MHPNLGSQFELVGPGGPSSAAWLAAKFSKNPSFQTPIEGPRGPTPFGKIRIGGDAHLRLPASDAVANLEWPVTPAALMQSAPGPETIIDGVGYLYFGGTSYLGLAGHPEVIEA